MRLNNALKKKPRLSIGKQHSQAILSVSAVATLQPKPTDCAFMAILQDKDCNHYIMPLDGEQFLGMKILAINPIITKQTIGAPRVSVYGLVPGNYYLEWDDFRGAAKLVPYEKEKK